MICKERPKWHEMEGEIENEIGRSLLTSQMISSTWLLNIHIVCYHFFAWIAPCYRGKTMQKCDRIRTQSASYQWDHLVSKASDRFHSRSHPPFHVTSVFLYISSFFIFVWKHQKEETTVYATQFLGFGKLYHTFCYQVTEFSRDHVLIVISN